MEHRPEDLGSRMEIGVIGMTFSSEVSAIREYDRIDMTYVGGIHRATGAWTFEEAEGGTRVCYEIEFEPQGPMAGLLAQFIDFGQIHRQLMGKVFDGLHAHLARLGAA